MTLDLSRSVIRKTLRLYKPDNEKQTKSMCHQQRHHCHKCDINPFKQNPYKVSRKVGHGVTKYISPSNIIFQWELWIVTDTYYGLIYHLISYIIEVWGGESQNSRNEFKMQNKAIGIFFGLRTKQSYTNLTGKIYNFRFFQVFYI